MLNFMLNIAIKVSSMANIFDKFVDWFQNFILSFIVFILYYPLMLIVSVALFILDGLQAAYLELIGLGSSSSGKLSDAIFGDVSGDILTDFLYNSSIQTVFRNFILVAIVLLLVFTVIAIVKSEYAQENTTKMQIVGRGVKALFTFFLVPALTFGGIYLSNQLLKTLYMAATPNQAETVGETIFGLAVSNANRAGYQINAEGEITYNDKKFYDVISSENVNSVNGGYFGTAGAQTGNNVTMGDIAAQVDYAFTHGISANVWTQVEDGQMKKLSALGVFTGQDGFQAKNITYHNAVAVLCYYDAFDINWFILIGGVGFALFFMLKLTLGLIGRIFNIVFLYAISPPIVAMMPLDNGNAFRSWRQQMVKHVLSGYGAVIGMNLFGVMCSVIQVINFGSGFGMIMKLLFVLVALQMASKFPGIIAGFIGGGDALSDGAGMTKGVAAGAAKIAKVGMGIAGGAVAGLKGAGKFMKDKNNFKKENKDTIKQDKQTMNDIEKKEDGSYGVKEGYEGELQGLSSDELKEKYESAQSRSKEYKSKYGFGRQLKGVGKGVGSFMKEAGGETLKFMDDFGGVSKSAGGSMLKEMFGKSDPEEGKNSIAGMFLNRIGVRKAGALMNAVDEQTNIKNKLPQSKIADNNEKSAEINKRIEDTDSAIAKEDKIIADNTDTKRPWSKTKVKAATERKNELLKSKEADEKELADLNKDTTHWKGVIDGNNKMGEGIKNKIIHSKELSGEEKTYLKDATAYTKQEEESNAMFGKTAEQIGREMGLDAKTIQALKTVMENAMREAFANGNPNAAGQKFEAKINEHQTLKTKISDEQIQQILQKYNENVEIANSSKEYLKQLADQDRKMIDEIRKLVEEKDKDKGKDKK